MEFFQEYHITIIGILFLGVIAAMAFLTHREKRWVKKNYPKDQIVALGFGITCYGLASDPGALKKLKGFLLVHKDGLLFKARFSDVRIDIPGESILKAAIATSHKGKRLYQSAIAIDYIPGRMADPAMDRKTDRHAGPDQSETIAFRVAYPGQWVKIIEKTFS